VVHRRELVAIGAGDVFVQRLLGRWRDMPLAARAFLCSGWTGSCSTIATSEAGAVYSRVVDHGRVVSIVNVRDVHVIHRTVVIEVPAAPISASITGANVPEAIVDAAVEADSRTPVSRMPDVHAATPTPVTRSP
jgi:hypothetical protein